MQKNDYQLLKREVLHDGVFRMVRYQLQHRLFNGEMSGVFSRELMERRSAVAVLPYDPITEQVLLIEQFRIGAVNSSHSPWLIEAIAGVYDPDEPITDVALREAKEEGGCDILALQPICGFFVSPGGCNEYLHLFCGHIMAEQLGGFHGLVEENEDIRAFLLSLDEAIQWLHEGKIQTSPAIIALQWLQLNRTWLKQIWQRT